MSKKIIYITLLCILTISLILLNTFTINPNQLKVRQEKLTDSKITKELDGKIIAYFSDLNYGEFIDNTTLDKISNKINDYNPDIIIFGGDVLDNHNLKEDEEDALINFFSSLNSKSGKFAILGDKDHSHLEEVLYLLDKGGFKVLQNVSEVIYLDKKNGFNLIGIDSYEKDLTTSYEGLKSNIYNIVLTHYPDDFDSLPLDKTDYVIASHSLGGQVYLPIINLFLREDGYQKYIKGKNTKNDTVLDISNGIGFKNKKVRLLADSEIVIYRLTY